MLDVLVRWGDTQVGHLTQVTSQSLLLLCLLPSLPFPKHRELGGPHLSHPAALSKEQAELSPPSEVSHQEAGSFAPGTMAQEDPGVEVVRAPPLAVTERSVSFGALS